MLGTREQTWLVVDIGSRWIKCARYVIRRGTVQETGSQVIDIQAEGLLSNEEVGAAIGRVLRSAGEHSVAVVLPQGAAVSQVMDLPEFSVRDRAGKMEDEVLELIGLSTERCVYDSHPLRPFGGYASPQWVTVAKEEHFGRHISPLLGQGLRVEAATTVGNALVAAFRHRSPEVEKACLVDIGAMQTTVARLERGEPVQMASFAHGGEHWVEALVEASGEAFEETEARLFRDDMFTDPVLGPVLHTAVGSWNERVVAQIDEWREELGMPEGSDLENGEIHLFGGYTAVRGLSTALTEVGGRSWTIPQIAEESPAPVWEPTYGAALMAAGLSGLKASILPRALAKMRERRLALSRLRMGVRYLLLLVLLVLGAAIVKQQERLEALVAANREAETALTKIETSAELLERRDKLAARIKPIIQGQLNSIASLETFRRLQRVYAHHDFTLIRFVDRQTYFQGIDDQAEASELKVAADLSDPKSHPNTEAFVVELAVPGGQAERLQALGGIVGRLREEKYFANVDRLVGESGSMVNALSGDDGSYALLLTLSDEPVPAFEDKEKGAAR